MSPTHPRPARRPLISPSLSTFRYCLYLARRTPVLASAVGPPLSPTLVGIAMRPESIDDNPVRLPALAAAVFVSAAPPSGRPSTHYPRLAPTRCSSQCQRSTWTPLLAPSSFSLSLPTSCLLLPRHRHKTRLISRSATIPKRRRCGHTAGAGESQSGLPHPLPSVETPHHLCEQDDRSISHRTTLPATLLCAQFCSHVI